MLIKWPAAHTPAVKPNVVIPNLQISRTVQWGTYNFNFYVEDYTKCNLVTIFPLT